MQQQGAASEHVAGLPEPVVRLQPQRDPVSGLSRQRCTTAGDHQIRLRRQRNPPSQCGGRINGLDDSVAHQQRLLLTAERPVDRSPGAGVAAEALLHIATVEVAEPPAASSVHHQVLVQPQPTELQGAVLVPGDHATVEDRSRQPDPITPQSTERQLADPIEEATVDSHHGTGGARQLWQEAQTLLAAHHRQGGEFQSKAGQVATGAQHLQRLDPHGDLPAFQHQPAAHQAGNRGMAQGQGRAWLSLHGLGCCSPEAIEHHAPGIGQGEGAQPGCLAPQAQPVSGLAWLQSQASQQALLA